MTTQVEEPKKFAIDYQIEDDHGNPIGPPQHFEADTQKELLELVKNAHRSAAKEMYKEKKARKIGDLITPDPERPVQKFERKSLTADERVRLANAYKDPQTNVEAARTILEAELGAPSDSIRQALQYVEVRQRIEMAQMETDKFLERHPEYVVCASNQEMILKWLEKRSYGITLKNLELAYEDLADMLTKQAKPTPVPTVATPVEAVPAPPPPEAIPTAATPAAAITATPVEVPLVPKSSSSGLGRDNASPAPGAEPPKAKGITLAQIAAMNSTQYAERLKDPAFQKMVNDLKL